MKSSPKQGDRNQSFLAHFDIFIAANRKGGIGKTTAILFLIACVLMRKGVIRGYEIDRQSRLQRLYTGLVLQVDMPGTEALIDDELAEGRALAPVYNAMRSPPNGELVFLDIGANFDERVAQGLLRANMGEKVRRAGRRVCVLIPLDGASDTITAAASAVEQFTTALPDAKIVFVERQANLSIDTSSKSLLSEAALKAYRDIIAPVRTPGSIIHIGQMRKSVHRAFIAMAKNPLDFMDSDPRHVGAAATEQVVDEHENEFAGEEILTHFIDFIGRIDEEAQRVLGFRPSPAEEASSEAEVPATS